MGLLQAGLAGTAEGIAGLGKLGIPVHDLRHFGLKVDHPPKDAPSSWPIPRTGTEEDRKRAGRAVLQLLVLRYGSRAV